VSQFFALGLLSNNAHYPFADVASDKKSMVHTLSLKEGFGGIYEKKGAKSFEGTREETKFDKEYIFFGKT